MSEWKIIPKFDFFILLNDVIRYSKSFALELISINGLIIILIVGLLIRINMKLFDSKFYKIMMTGSLTVTFFHYVTCALAAIYSYSEPWQTSSLSISTYFSLLMALSFTLSKIKVRENVDLIGKTFALLLIIAIGLSSSALSLKFSMTMTNRADLWDLRWSRGTTESVPVLSRTGIPLVMDTEGDPWVTGCYRKARGV
jgi:hypothetical protein